MFCLLNAFCCIQTERSSPGANRFLSIFLLEFNHAGQLASLLLQLITFDHTRLIYQPGNESTYLIFTYLLHGAALTHRHELHLNDFNLSNPDHTSKDFIHRLLTTPTTSDETDSSKLQFQRLLDAFRTLQFEENEIKSLLTILAAIVHLNLAGACRISSNVPASGSATSNGGQSNVNASAAAAAAYRAGQFKSPNDAHKAAKLLGISYNQLNDAIFSLVSGQSTAQTSGNGLSTTPKNKYSHLSNNGSSRVSPDTMSMLSLTPIECVQGFCMGLYQECLNLIVNCINRTFKPSLNQNQAICNSMLLIDPPGFQSQSASG